MLTFAQRRTTTGQDRLFSLTWDNSKLRIDPRERQKKREARGTHYANGYVTLNNGNVFESMSELEHHLEVSGKYELTYDDEVQG